MTLARTPMPWRGTSNRLYPVTHAELDDTALHPSVPSLLIAIARDPHGIAQIRDGIASEDASPGWPDRARASGATELHLYALSRSDDPASILSDLGITAKASAAKSKTAKRRAA